MGDLAPTTVLSQATPERLTPRGNPNYDIFFSDDKIKSVVEKAVPGVSQEQMTIEHLPSGKSFNNRIYFINLDEPIINARPEWYKGGVEVARSSTKIQVSSFVLKIAGHPFGVNKIQNEVACLLLLEKHCPSIPCPKIIAWSDNGKRVRTPKYPRGIRDASIKNIPVLAIKAEDGVPMDTARPETEGQGWMLMTREPGNPLTLDDLSGNAGDDLMREIAGYVSTWRQSLPPAPAAGNLRIVRSGATPSEPGIRYDEDLVPGYEVHIDGIITSASPPLPLISTDAYAHFCLSTALQKLKEEQFFGSASDMLHDKIKKFLDLGLERLAMFHFEFEPMVFTHDDISTRNVLAVRHDDGTVKVSSIIDFEFAGFFPRDEEFANCMQNDTLEWPIQKYASFLSELKDLDALPESLADRIPDVDSLGEAADKAVEFGTHNFHQATFLRRLCINTAPFWLAEDKDCSEEELVVARAEAQERIEKALAFLHASKKKG